MQSIITAISVILFLAVMLTLKFLVIPPFVQTYGFMGVIAFVSTMLAIALWWEKKEKPAPIIEPPKPPEPDFQAWARKIGDDLARAKPDPDIIDVKFTVIEPLKPAAKNVSPAPPRIH